MELVNHDDGVFGTSGGLLEALRALDQYTESQYDTEGNVGLDLDQKVATSHLDEELVNRSTSRSRPSIQETSQTACDLEEQQTLSEFLTTPCCKKMCNTTISKHAIESYRNDIHELSKHELDLVVLAQISAFRRRPCVLVRSTSKTETNVRSTESDVSKKDDLSLHLDRDTDSEDESEAGLEKHHLMTESDKKSGRSAVTVFYFAGIQICKTMFMFLHCIKSKVYRNISKHFDETDSIQNRVHKNSKKQPHNALDFEDRERIKTYIHNLSVAKGMPLPGRLPGTRDTSLLLLPSNMTKSNIHREYSQFCEEEGHRSAGLTTFKEVWSKTIPEVTPMKPSTDLCQTCQQNTTTLMRAAGFPDAVKQTKLNDAINHLQRADTQRQYYKAQCNEAKLGNGMHLSFDFAQQVHYPFSAQQVGPAYFKSARKCQIFGITQEAVAKQVNYLIDEADQIGKGSNCVTSMVHHYLTTNEPSMQLCFHADNCVGQNKNNTLMGYFAWRTCVDLSESVEVSFMLEGHTKFAPDCMFGLIKKELGKSQIDNICDLAQVVRRSSPGGHNGVQLTVDPETGKRYVAWYDWSTFVAKYFKNIPEITSFYHFRFSSKEKGGVFCRKSANAEEVAIKISKPGISLPVLPTELPEQLAPQGLTPQRQWYLYENIHSLCSSRLAGDMICPKPTTAKPPKATKISHEF